MLAVSRMVLFLPLLGQDVVGCTVAEFGSRWTRLQAYTNNQELIEPAKPAREHVTTIDSEIQTWRSDANFI